MSARRGDVVTLSTEMTMAMKHSMWVVVIGVLLAPAAALAQDEVVYFQTDAIGSVRVVTDATGVVIARYDYLPFGEPWDPPQNPDSRRFAGKELDAETGLDYFGARYYRGQSARFTSVDPVLNIEAALTDPQRWNRYSYAVNRPLVMIDPDGREAGYVYLSNGQMVAPIRSMTPTMAALWGGTVAAGGAALVGIGGAAATEAAAFALLVRNSTAVMVGLKVLANVTGVSDSRIAIPGPTNAPLGKLDYLLGRVSSVPSAGKGKFFDDMMGFSDKTLDAALRSHLQDHASSMTRNAKGFFEVVGSMSGPSGLVAQVRSVWQIVNGKFQFITAHMVK